MNKGGEHETVFVNPYNFIPISKNAPMRVPMHAAGQSEGKDGRLTGVIEYSVLTKTPLFIPNTSNKDGLGMGIKDHNSYDFFTYTDLSGAAGPAADAMPVIPGSEIRGMFRSNYEILTNSCMSAVDDDVTLSKRTNQTYCAGLIKRTRNGEKFVFDLYQAEDCLIRTEKKEIWPKDVAWMDDKKWGDDKEHNERRCYKLIDLKEGTGIEVYVHRRRGKYVKPLALMDSKSGEEKERAYILKGEDGPEMKDRSGKTKKEQKHCGHAFVLNKKNNRPVRKGISLSTLDTVLKAYKDNGEHLYSEYSEQLSLFREGTSREEYFPVYYSCETPGYEDGQTKEKRLMLSPACITREIYGRKIKDMIGEHRPCSRGDSLCPACALFGTVGRNAKGQNFSRASRIRFADLVCDENSPSECFMNTVTLEPLSSPKLNNMEFYLERPAEDAVFWTYDYYIDEKGRIHRNEAGLNGRKFYWHNLHPKMKNMEATSQNMTVRPVRKGITFCGKLFFQDLSEEELNQLIYLLNCGENALISKKNHGYKLGGAKPLGLGSIAVKVDAVTCRKISIDPERRTVQRVEVPYEDYKDPEFDSGILDGFTKMTDFHAAEGLTVSYPVPDPDSDEEQNIFEWFVGNHRGYRFNKRENQNVPTKMPSARKEMAYADHMQALNPLLQPTVYRKIVDESGGAEQGLEATVTGVAKNGRFVRINIIGQEKKKNCQIPIKNSQEAGKDLKKEFPVGRRIRVIFTEDVSGANGIEYHNYRMVKNC